MMKIFVVFVLPTTFPKMKSLYFSASPTLRVLVSFPLPTTFPQQLLPVHLTQNLSDWVCVLAEGHHRACLCLCAFAGGI